MEQLSSRKKIAATILAALALIALSLWGGMMIAQAQAKKTSAQGTNIRTTIAVVNMDNGVTYNGQTVNYANSFISTLGDDVTVVSASAAADGFKNGVYGGVITIPADMSAKIVSINAENPAQVALTYEINDQLPRDKYIDVYKRINDAQQSLRSSLAFVFETSIFDDIHKSQANVAQLKTNDTTDLSSVDKLRQTNFMVGLKIADVPDIQPAYQGYGDTAKISVAGGTLAQDIGGLYNDEYLAMQGSYDTAQTDITSTQGSITTWEQAQETYLADLETGQAAYLSEVNDYYALLSDFYAGLKSYDSAATAYDVQAQAFYTESNAYRQALSQYQTDLDDYKNQLADISSGWLEAGVQTGLTGYRSKAVTDVNAAVNTALSTLTVNTSGAIVVPSNFRSSIVGALPTVADYMAATYSVPATQTPGLPLYTDDPAHIVVTDTLGAPPVYSPLDQKYLTGIYKDGVPSPTDTVQPGADSLATIIDSRPSGSELSGYFDAQNLAITTYNPSIYFNDKLMGSVKDKITGFDTEVSTLRSGLDAAQTDNLSKLGQAHSGYQSYVTQVGSDATAQYDADSKKLENALNSFYAQKLTTSEDNTKLLTNIAGLLPYSQINGANNKKVVEFIVDPLSVQQMPYLSVTTVGFDVRKFLQTGLLVIAGTSALALILLLTIKRRKEREFQV